MGRQRRFVFEILCILFWSFLFCFHSFHLLPQRCQEQGAGAGLELPTMATADVNWPTCRCHHHMTVARCSKMQQGIWSYLVPFDNFGALTKFVSRDLAHAECRTNCGWDRRSEHGECRRDKISRWPCLRDAPRWHLVVTLKRTLHGTISLLCRFHCHPKTTLRGALDSTDSIAPRHISLHSALDLSLSLSGFDYF